MWHLRPWPWPTGTSPTPLTHPHECLFALRLVLQSDKRPSPSGTFSGFKNRQFRQHFSTGRYCSVGEEASVAEVEGEVHNDHLPRWDWIYCPHTAAQSRHTKKNLAGDVNCAWIQHQCSFCRTGRNINWALFQLAAVASSWGIVGRKILQKGRTRTWWEVSWPTWTSCTSLATSLAWIWKSAD